MVLTSCNQELKEHPISPQVKQQLAAKKEASDPSQSISGTIVFDELIAPAVTTTQPGTLFIIARPEGVSSGPPLAVKRHSLIKFPFEYRIGQENIMIKGNKFKGNLTITARWDLDGLAKASPGDIEGSVTVPSGSVDVKIFLDRILKEENKPTDAKTVSGVIRIDPALVHQIPEGASLFLIARTEGKQRGMPLAVKKLEKVTLPYSFSLGQSDIMLPGVEFGGPITIFARLDKDGDASPGSGDIDGRAVANVGDQKVEIVLNNVIGS